MDTNKPKMLHKSNVQLARFKIIFAGQSGGIGRGLMGLQGTA